MNWMFFAKLGSMVISFIATAYIARKLGPINYGELSYAISFTGLFGFIASLGIDQILYRDLIKFPEKKNEYMGTALLLRLLAGLITIIICMVSAFIFSPRDVSLILIFIVSLTFVFSSFQLLNYEFQAAVKSKYPSLVSLFVVLILNILKIITIILGNGIIYLAAIILLEPILYGVGFVYFRIKEFGTIKHWRYNKEIAVSILKDSFPLIFASAFFAVYARIDQVMIKNMMDARSVGLYSSAVSISEVWYFIPNMIVITMFPAIINAQKTSNELYYKRTKKLFIGLIFVTVIIALTTSVLSKYFIYIIYGSGFIGALTILQIYVWSNIGAVLNMLSQQLLIAENLTKMITVTAFLGMADNIILNIYLIPIYGMTGAAFASLISYLIPFFSLIFFKQARKIIINTVKA
jgi:O-antigen/teichoic acid export membrane protein